MSDHGADVQVIAVPYDSAHHARRMGAGPMHLLAYVHVDLDVLDEREGRVNAYSGGPGLSRAELLEAIAAAGRRCRVVAGAITAYDPGYDPDGRVARTAIDVALALAEAARPDLAP